MSETLVSMFDNIDKMLISCKFDYDELIKSTLDSSFFDDYKQTRIVNSFLFNFGKLQDKIGAKLFKQILYELKEIDTFNHTMIDILNHLERLRLIDSIAQWEELREIRNILAHEYPFEIEERVENVENIGLALEGFVILHGIYNNIKNKSLLT